MADTFTTIPRYSTESGVVIVRSGSGGGGGLSPEQADDRYFRIANNLSEGNAATIRGNIGLGTSDSPTFAGATVNGNVDISASSPFLTVTATANGREISLRPNVAAIEFTGASNLEINRTSSANVRIGQGGGNLLVDNKAVVGDTSFFGTEAFRVVGRSHFKGVAGNDIILEDVSTTNSWGVNAGIDMIFSSAPSPGGTYTEVMRLKQGGGVVIGDTTLFGSETFRNVGASRLEGAVDITGDIEFATQIASDDYVSGILGTGSIVDNDATGGSLIEVDNMRIRKEFRTHIFRKDTVRATNGLFYVSDVSEVVEEKTFGNTDTGVTLDIKAGSSYATFTVGNELLVKNVDPDEGSNNFVEFDVTAVDTSDPDFTRLTVDIINSNGGTVYEGDTIVRTSGGVLLLDAVTANSPFMDVAEDSSMKVRLGNLNGVTNASGWGLYGENTFLTGALLVGDLTETSNYMKFDGSSLEVNTDTFDLDTTTLIVESTTPKIALGASADSLGLTSISDTGTFLNGSGHVRVGTTDGSGNLTRGFTFDGTDFLLEAGNASIGASSGWFGANNILTYSASSVGLAGFTADADSLFQVNTGIEINMGTASSYATTVFGFSVGTSTDNRIWMGVPSTGAGIYRFGVQEGGDYLVRFGDENHIAGWNFDTTDFWAGGDGTKGNATVRLDSANGQIFYDAMGGSIFARQSLASFGSGTSASAIDSSSWSEQASAPFPSTDTQRNTKIRLRYLHRFGINNLIVQGKTRQVEQSSSTAVHTSRIYATVKDDGGTEQASEFVQIGASSFTDFSISLDVSGLTEDTYYILEIDVFAFVEGADDSGINTHSTTTHLREDVFVTTAT